MPYEECIKARLKYLHRAIWSPVFINLVVCSFLSSIQIFCLKDNMIHLKKLTSYMHILLLLVIKLPLTCQIATGDFHNTYQ